MSTPVRRSISASASTNGSASSRASWRPTALLPEPIGPTRKTFELTGMQKEKRPQVCCGRLFSHRERGASVDVRTLAQDLRSDEDQQLVLVVGPRLAAEQHSEARDVTEVRHLVGGVTALGLEDAA